MDELHKEAIRSLDIIHSYCGDNCDPQVHELWVQARQLFDDFETHKNPRHIENQAKKVKEFIRTIGTDAMTVSHRQDLVKQYEHIRLGLRKFQ